MSKHSIGTAAMIDALKKAEGFITVAAGILRCNRATVGKYIRKYPSVKAAFQDIIEKRHDDVESELMKKIRSGNTACIIFYCKTQMKQRGYVEHDRTWREIFACLGMNPDDVFQKYVDHAKQNIESAGSSDDSSVPSV